MRILVLLTVIVFAAANVFAQNTILEGQVIDARSNNHISLALVELTSLQDSSVYRQTTGVDGKFRISGIKTLGMYVLSVHKPGYANFIKIIELEMPLEQTGNIIMVDSARLLEETTVKAKRNAIRIRGDTIEYSSTYYKTNPDMDAVYLINKLPGIDLKSKTANGDSISKFMINGIIIFNDQPEKILAQIPAGVIEKILVYSDTGDVGNMGIRSIHQARIVNVKTNEGYLAHFKGKLYAGYAVSDYFLVGFNTMRQRNEAQLSVSGSTNRGSIKYGSYYEPSSQFRSTGIPWISQSNINYSRQLNNKDLLNIDYSVYDNDARVERTKQYQYSLETDRGYLENSSSREYNQLSNSLNLKWTRVKPNSNKVILFSSINTGNNQNDESNKVRSAIAGDSIQTINQNQGRKNEYSAKAGVTFFSNRRKSHKMIFGAKYLLVLRDEEATNKGLVSSPDTNYAINYQNANGMRSNTLGLNLSSESKLTDRNLINAGFESENKLSHSDQHKNLFSNLANGYTIGDPQFSNPAADYGLSDNKFVVKDVCNFRDNKTILEFGAALQGFFISSRPVFSRSYVDVNPFINITVRYSTLKELRMNLEKRDEVPQFEQLNPIVNASSAYFYRAGNLDLKPANRYSFSIFYKDQLLAKGNFFSTHLSLIYIKNNIVETSLIPSTSALSFQGRAIPPGSMLISWQNVDDYRYLYYALNYDMPIAAIRTVWKFRTNFQARSSNSLLNNLDVNTSSYDYAVNSTFSSVMSTKIDCSLFMAYNYNRTRQTSRSTLTRDLHQYKLNALVVTQLDKRQSLRMESNINAISGLSATDKTRFYLVDVSYQIKALRDRKLMLTVTLHDLFNSYKNYDYEYQYNSNFGNSADIIYSSHTNDAGRYLLFLLSYNL